MLLFRDLSYAINGAAFQVYNALGHGFLESIEFQRRNIPYEREKELTLTYDGVELKQTFRADFVCYGKIIVELKAVSELNDAHRSQVYNYLHATGYKLGLLYNFGCPDELEIERIILP